jgi:CDP-diacylglycerol---serine O-phosphatidyltransferase
MSLTHPLRRREDDKQPRRLRRGLYILPSIFTAANIAAGYYAIVQITQGSFSEPWHFDFAARAIGFAVVFDALDGFFARMTRTSSDFGRELDSLADVITFGVAPALLSFLWGFRLLPVIYSPNLRTRLVQFGAIASFIFLMAGASRLARFNIQMNPQPSNPGRPGKRYFVGMPIPAGAGVIAAVVHFASGIPLNSWWMAVVWLLLVLCASFLMVSTWRFYSFKDLDWRSRRPFRLIIVLGVLIYAIWTASQIFLFVLALTYMGSGVIWRLQWLFRRRGSGVPPPPYKEASQTS